jgi:hypothetical protein
MTYVGFRRSMSLTCDGCEELLFATQYDAKSITWKDLRLDL